MRIAIIGAGNVATHLAVALSAKADIVQIYSRHRENACCLASRITPEPAVTDRADEIIRDADVYIVSVKDDAIAEIAATSGDDDGLWVHTSGSVPMSVFAGRKKRYGVLYPLQTFSKDVAVDMAEVPFFVEGGDEATADEIKDIARLMSPVVNVADSEQRKRIHAAAVFACNFTNHLWAVAEKILNDGGYGFDVLMPLLRVTLDKAGKVSPSAGQTGPARRGDTGTMQRHIELLDDADAEIYRMLSRSIMEKYNVAK